MVAVDLRHDLNDLLATADRYRAERVEVEATIAAADDVAEAEAAILRAQAIDAVVTNLQGRIEAKRQAIAEAAQVEAAAQLVKLRTEQHKLVLEAVDALHDAVNPLTAAEALTPDVAAAYLAAKGHPMFSPGLHEHLRRLQSLASDLQRTIIT